MGAWQVTLHVGNGFPHLGPLLLFCRQPRDVALGSDVAPV
jgi:hypothetical protein